MRYNLETKKDLKFVSGKLYERHHVKAFAETFEQAKELLKNYLDSLKSDETTEEPFMRSSPIYRGWQQALFATVYVEKKEKETYFPVLHFEKN